MTELEEKILELRQKKGMQLSEISKNLSISNYQLKKIIEELKIKNLYDEDKVKKAISNRKRREKYQENKNNTTPKLTIEEEQYRKKCIEFLCVNFFDYNKTKKINPVLIKKIQDLGKISSYHIIYNTIISYEKVLRYSNQKKFQNEYTKIAYIISIIKNNLKNIWELNNKNEKESKKVFNKTDDDLLDELNKNRITKKVSRVDLSEFLDD